MKFNDSIRSALRGQRTNKMRTALTMLGIIIGVSSVILIMSIGASAQSYILGQVEGFGSNLISVDPGPPNDGPPAAVLGVVIKTLNERDAESLRREPSVVAVVPMVSGSARAVYGNEDRNVFWQGTTEEFFTIFDVDFAAGGPFTRSDVQAYNHVVVLGSKIAEDLFGDRNPVGRSIRFRDMSFRVVGVLEPKGAGVFSMDDYALIPLTVGQRQLLGIDYYQSLSIKAADVYDVGFTMGRVTSILRQNHRITDADKDDFTVQSQEDALELLGNITSILTLFLSAIAAISLVVGGIGIMNIMLVSVTERTREIGLRKAIGATERDILSQFLVESVIITSIGGFIGLLVGAALTGLAYVGVTTFAGIAWSFELPPNAVLLAVGVSVFTGLVFGVYPARQAARKNPIDALRYE